METDGEGESVDAADALTGGFADSAEADGERGKEAGVGEGALVVEEYAKEFVGGGVRGFGVSAAVSVEPSRACEGVVWPDSSAEETTCGGAASV